MPVVFTVLSLVQDEEAVQLVLSHVIVTSRRNALLLPPPTDFQCALTEAIRGPALFSSSTEKKQASTGTQSRVASSEARVVLPHR